ncbi:MAG: S41 family peptidase, partial [Cetobacterium sp.]
MIKLLRSTGVALLLSGFMLVNSVSAYSVDNGFISNIKELKELSDIMNIIKENHVGAEKEATNTTLMQGALKGMMESLDDPHSNYFTKEEL